MCGIVGELTFDNSQVEKEQIERMRDCLIHRGPDDSGVFLDRQIGLGFRRLAIIDLSASGHQPMQSADGKVTIIFNGEIYNFQELRKQLQGRGHTFRSQTDTEVILALYQKHGLNFLGYLRGMFAIALWDSTRQQLILARDRLGKKPLKYYQDHHKIIFASELKAILAHRGVPRQLDPVAIHHYLTFQYVPSPRTGFQGIKKLPPAHYLLIRNGRAELRRYWQLDFSKKVSKSTAEWRETVVQSLEESVRLRMISDVPLGAFLSGGIDSSVVVGLMAKHSPEPVKTFSIGFAERSHSELPYAKMIADRFGTDHTEFVVEPHAVDLLPKLAYHYEEPYADSSALPTYILSELTRQHVTVALNGDGGDENFAGYERYPIFLFGERYRRMVPRPIHQLIVAGAHALRKVRPTTFFDRTLRFVQSVHQEPVKRYLEYLQYFSDEQKTKIYHPEFTNILADTPPSWELLGETFDSVPAQDVVDRLLATDIATYLPDDLLVKVDIASMAVSLEARSPFLDHTFMELMASMPSALKLHRYHKKYILREAMRGFIPDEVLDRKKMGFGVPIEHWFRGSLNGFIKEHLLDGRFEKRAIIQKRFVESLLERHTRGRVNYAHQLWALLMLELWFETFFDSRP